MGESIKLARKLVREGIENMSPEDKRLIELEIASEKLAGDLHIRITPFERAVAEELAIRRSTDLSGLFLSFLHQVIGGNADWDKYQRMWPLWSTEDVAEQLNLSTNTIKTLVHDGKLPVVKINSRTWRFRPEDIIAFVEKCRVE